MSMREMAADGRDIEAGWRSLFRRVFLRDVTAAANQRAPETPPSLYLAGADRLVVEAFHEAAWYIGEERINGDIVDCGIGETNDLKLVALALLSRGERRRRLVLFDTSMMPAHRAEKVMPLWGSWGEALFRANSNGLRTPPSPRELIPTALARTEYPATNIRFVTQFTSRAINSSLSQQIAWLLMTCDTHAANPLVLSHLLPRLVNGAIIIVRGTAIEQEMPVCEPIRMLRERLPRLELKQLSGSYWIGKIPRH